MADSHAPTERFGDRADAYVRHRPGYPAALHAWLRGLGFGSGPVADIGAGTGQSARLWLDLGHNVIAVEPNDAMRAAGAAALAGESGVRWRKGTAEATTLADASVDVVAAAQAFHWFDPERVRAEWARVLRPGGAVVVAWNTRAVERAEVAAGFEALLATHGRDYAGVAARKADDAAMRAWFGAGLQAEARFPHAQRLDREGLHGRLLSTSSAPRPGEPGHAAMHDALDALFARHAVDGAVDLDYDTRAFVGTLH
jgi:SAM-dependent methyltransferase